MQDFNYERMPKENADGVITMPLPTVSKRKGSVISLPGGRRLSLRLEVITPLPKTKEVDNESMHDLDNFDGVHSNKKEDTLPEEADSAEELAVNNDLVKIADTLEAKSATAGVDNSVKMTATHVQDDAGQMTMDKERTLAAEAPIVSALKKNAI